MQLAFFRGNLHLRQRSWPPRPIFSVRFHDAMDAGQRPGTLYYCRSGYLAGPGQRHSLHEMGLRNILEFIDEPRRPEVHILGVQPRRIEFALQLSSEVASVLPHVVHAARRIIAESG